MSLEELVALPEEDSWRYSSYGSSRPVFTPASFVASALRELGVFHDVEINASEFTVKDIYQLDIFEKGHGKPELCDEADLSLDYCQLFGKYRLELPGYSTVKPYDHMNEKCPNPFENSVAPIGC